MELKLANEMLHHFARFVMLILVRPVQPENAKLPIVSMEEGIVILVNPLHLRKALSPML